MKPVKYQIFVIGEDCKANQSFCELVAKYGEQNVIFINEKDSIEHIKGSLSKQTLVLVSNFSLIEQIRQISSLLYILFLPKKALDTIPHIELEFLINSPKCGVCFLAEENRYPKLLQQVEKGFKWLSAGVDVCLEKWILSLDADGRAEKNIVSPAGQHWSLDDLLQQIRRRTPEGIEAEKNIITLAIDTINRGKKR